MMANQQVAIISPQFCEPYSVDLNIVRKLMNLSEGAFEVTDVNDPKVIDRIKKKLFGATTITRKTILEGGFVVVDDGSGSGSSSGSAIGDNDAPIVFEIKNHFDYDHTSYTDFATPSECSACKCQDYKSKHDVVINVINALIASVKEMTSKRGVILSKRISYPYTSLEINVAKRRRKEISKTSSIIKKSKIITPLSLSCTFDQCISDIGEPHELKKVNKYHLFQQINRHIFVSTDDISVAPVVVDG
ncbi:hypothetical protein T459_25831 [Capsicum annuum]|uniref:Uncharacterized protein n=1 Tax=Capsicum annuum TaxID=4072 RepID=A0A2G2YLV1_CAPAN|nr:hypothetical protein FXO37_02153 [Capsicum annuum]PHT70727.1 hypothetical protein T459_25831 [Capsicum annuum]